MVENHYNCIYKLTSPSGKVYIGQAQDFNKRMYQHSITKGLCKKLYNAIKHYGWDKFTAEILIEDVDTQEELDRLEIQYIAEYNSIDEGYNITAGGCGAKRPDGHNINYGTGRYGITTFDPDYGKINAKDWYNNHRERARKTMANYQLNNKEKISKQKKEYATKNKDKFKEYHHDYYQEHKEELRERDKLNYELNRPKRLVQKREYYQKHKDKWKESGKQRRENNKEKIKQQKHEEYIRNKNKYSQRSKIRYYKEKALLKNNGQMELTPYL